MSGYQHQPAYDSGRLQVDDIHNLHYEQYGKQDGKPVVFLHGGPGGQTSIDNTAFFDPSVYRVVLFDQRGAGKSTPLAETRDNTTKHLVADIEQLRKHLGIDKWHLVFGGSWGSTLAIMYAQAHPEVVGALALRGIFTGRKTDMEFSRGPTGAAMLFPEEWEAFINHLTPEKRNDPGNAYYELLTSSDPQVARAAARAISSWDMSIDRLETGPDKLEKLNDEDWLLAHSMLISYYTFNKFFMEDGELLREENIKKMRQIPGSIVHGRYDILSPPKSAWDLHQVWPESNLYMIPAAGHSVKEPGMFKKLVEVCDEYAKLEI